jgi:hypothetical protein
VLTEIKIMQRTVGAVNAPPYEGRQRRVVWWVLCLDIFGKKKGAVRSVIEGGGAAALGGAR